MKKYVASRKDICAGRLTKHINESFNICDEFGREISNEQLAENGICNLHISRQIIYRGMLFNVNENGLANDLIYTTPTNYQIEGIEPKIEGESELVIDKYVELEELLKYLNYDEDLTQKDLD